MVRIFEKKPISYDDEYGIDSINDKDIFKKGPCIITILAQTWFLSSINGAMRIVANLVNPNINEIYDQYRRIFGLSFGDISLGGFLNADMTFSESNPTDAELTEFIDTYFIPLISNNNSKINTINAMKNIRNINFITYCDGAKIYKRIEEILEKRMSELRYTNEEINLILSQISLAAVSSNTIENGTKATALLFNDKNDHSINNDYQSSLTNNSFVKHDKCHIFIVDGDGNHDFRKYMGDDLELSTAIKLFLNKSLENSIFNYRNDTFIPINSESFIIDIINSYNERQQSEIEYKTYSYTEDKNTSNFIFSLYRKYKDTNNRISINELIEKLNLSSYSSDIKDKPNMLIEVAYQDNEVLAFCTHGNYYFNQNEIQLMVCSKQYRKKGIATRLLNNVFLNMDMMGINSCILETSKEYDNYNFWIDKGAFLIRTRRAGIFEEIKVSILQFSNIKEYLENANNQTDKKLVKSKL